MPVLIFLFCLSAFSQPWNPYYRPYEPQTCVASSPQPEPEPEYQEPLPMEDPYGFAVEHYSWDNLYLCQYCDTEIIIEPYTEEVYEEEE